MLEKVKNYAISKHLEVNHKYDNHDYSFHLRMVYNYAVKFSYLLNDKDKENVYCGCWVHDIIEDARETYNDVKNESNVVIAELAYALTNEKGRNRSERANDKYYIDMHKVPNANFIKICDRIANISYSRDKGSSMFNKYKQENANFVKKVYKKELSEMFDFVEGLLDG